MPPLYILPQRSPRAPGDIDLHGLLFRNEASAGWLEHNSNLDLIRNDPRFQALLKRLE